MLPQKFQLVMSILSCSCNSNLHFLTLNTTTWNCVKIQPDQTRTTKTNVSKIPTSSPSKRKRNLWSHPCTDPPNNRTSRARRVNARHKRSTRTAHAAIVSRIPLGNAHASACSHFDAIKRSTRPKGKRGEREREREREKNGGGGPVQGGCATHLRGFSWPVATGWIGVEDGGERRALRERPFGPVSKHGKTPIDRFPRNGDTPPVRRNEDEQPSSVQTSNRPPGTYPWFSEPNFQAACTAPGLHATTGALNRSLRAEGSPFRCYSDCHRGGFYLIETINEAVFLALFSLFFLSCIIWVADLYFHW